MPSGWLGAGRSRRRSAGPQAKADARSEGCRARTTGCGSIDQCCRQKPERKPADGHACQERSELIPPRARPCRGRGQGVGDAGPFGPIHSCVLSPKILQHILQHHSPIWRTFRLTGGGHAPDAPQQRPVACRRLNPSTGFLSVPRPIRQPSAAPMQDGLPCNQPAVLNTERSGRD
jgi:hypothetical protein